MISKDKQTIGTGPWSVLSCNVNEKLSCFQINFYLDTDLMRCATVDADGSSHAVLAMTHLGNCVP